MLSLDEPPTTPWSLFFPIGKVHLRPVLSGADWNARRTRVAASVRTRLKWAWNSGCPWRRLRHRACRCAAIVRVEPHRKLGEDRGYHGRRDRPHRKSAAAEHLLKPINIAANSDATPLSPGHGLLHTIRHRSETL